MKKLIWNQQLSMNNKTIDDQHKELLRIANGLLKAVHTGKSKQTINNVIRRLREYTVYHFSSEEGLMDKMRFKKRGEHATEHHRLKHQVKDFQHRMFHHEQVSSDEVLKFLKTWLLEHLLSYDRDFADFIKECDEMKKEKEKVDETNNEESD